jgi:hypothetical protein
MAHPAIITAAIAIDTIFIFNIPPVEGRTL